MHITIIEPTQNIKTINKEISVINNKININLKFQYAVLLGIIFVVEFAVGIAAAVFKSDLEMALKNSLEKTIQSSTDEDLKAWDNIQMKLMCCGITSPSDWRDKSKDHLLRSSCCVKEHIGVDGDCRDSPLLGKDKYYQVQFIPLR